MKIPAIKILVEKYNAPELVAAENAIINGEDITIEVDGEDEGEKLTHIIAALWIQQSMKTQDLDFKDALREYTKKVRTSIS
jgi:hypothetical protein